MLLFLWIVIFSVDAMNVISDPDTPWHIATGQYILQHHRVPTADMFSWSMFGKPWVTQEWLFEAVLAWLCSHLGFLGYWLLIVLVHAITVTAVYLLCSRVTPFSRTGAAIVACLSTLVAWPFWVVRPQIISYAFFALMLLLLERVRRGHFRVLWFVPPLILVWANAHSSVSIGLLMLLFDVFISFVPEIGRLRKYSLPKGARWRLIATAIVSIAVAMLNPNGMKEITYAVLSSNHLMISSINEWHSPDFHSTYYKYGVLLFFGVVLVIIAASKRRPSLRQTLYFAGTFGLTLVYQRFVPYFALATAPLVAELAAGWVKSLDVPSKLLRIFSAGIMVLSAGYLAIQVPATKGSVDNHLSHTTYPVDAVDYLLAHPISGRLLNAYNFGGYLIYRHIPTFVDGRTDIYLQNNVFADYMTLQNLGFDAPTLLDSYQFHYALLPSNYALTVFLNHNEAWREVYQDGVAEILVRKDMHS
jgi:hypothetical protein